MKIDYSLFKVTIIFFSFLFFYFKFGMKEEKLGVFEKDVLAYVCGSLAVVDVITLLLLRRKNK